MDLCFVVVLFILLSGEAVLPCVLELRICGQIYDTHGVSSMNYWLCHLRQFLHLFEPQFSHMYKSLNKRSTYLGGLC